ncbi:MAG: hypothetical protein LVS60_04675 [Nodosilinea sp. LVE1205-7]|jgi:hypothetical protein
MVDWIDPFFPLKPGTIAGTALWAITLYLAYWPRVQRYTDWLYHRLDQSPGRLWSGLASLLSVVPLVCLGALIQFVLTLTLGGSWGVSLGVIASMACGIYELGRQDGEASD